MTNAKNIPGMTYDPYTRAYDAYQPNSGLTQISFTVSPDRGTAGNWISGCRSFVLKGVHQLAHNWVRHALNPTTPTQGYNTTN
jgi:hypothetical protein